MTKRLLFVMGVYCCSFFRLTGMELVLKKYEHHKNSVSSDNIPFFPLMGGEKMSSIRDIFVKNDSKHEDLLCSIALLPQELQKVIALKMFDDNSVAAEAFLKTPFIYAMTFYHQDKQLLKNRLLVKEIPLDLLFCIPSVRKKEIVAIAASQHPVRFLYEDKVFTQEQVEKMRLLDSQGQNDFFIGEEVMVIEPETTWKKYSYAIPCGCAGIGFLSTAIVATTSCLAKNCSKFIFVVGGITVASSCILGAVGAGILYAHVIKNNIRREVI